MGFQRFVAAEPPQRLPLRGRRGAATKILDAPCVLDATPLQIRRCNLTRAVARTPRAVAASAAAKRRSSFSLRSSFFFFAAAACNYYCGDSVKNDSLRSSFFFWGEESVECV